MNNLLEIISTPTQKSKITTLDVSKNLVVGSDFLPCSAVSSDT